ncbi:MAG: PAS domain-containing protein [Rhizobiales bacterium]|nr:PAS domain-containing protein [Hyphomicrobiales bacterium]
MSRGLEPAEAGPQDPAEVRASEQRLRLAIAATGIGIWDVDAASGTRQWSPEFLAILGLPPETGPDQEVFASLIHPDDAERVLALYSRAYSSPDDPTYQAEFRIRRADDGAERWVVTTGRVYFSPAGKPLRGVGTLRDVDARRRMEEALRLSEERHRLAIAANRLGSWDSDLLRDEHGWSPEYYELWGLDPALPADPARLQPLMAHKDWQRLQLALAEARESDGRMSIEVSFTRPGDATPRWALLQGRVFFDAGGRPVRTLGIVMDTTERKQAEERQRLLLNELNHRVKNTLATVQAIVSQTLRSTPDPDAAFERVQSRLMALSNTHNLLNATSWAGATLGDVLGAELKPYRSQGERVQLRGEPVALDARTALAFGLIAHELVTNAAKYGSLSAPDGRLEVAWRLAEGENGQQVELTWREAGGPEVAKPTRKGFGSRLVERSIRDLRGTADIDYAPGGLICRLIFMLDPWGTSKDEEEEPAPESATSDEPVDGA